MVNNVLYLYLDDIRTSNTCFGFNQFCQVKSVNKAKFYIMEAINSGITEIWFDLDHDLGDYTMDGGDAIKLIDWLVEEFYDKDMNFKFHFHSMNPVGVKNMRTAIEKYWEVY